MEYSFCPKCNASSGLSIFDCLHRKNNRYCPYKLVKIEPLLPRKFLILIVSSLASVVLVYILIIDHQDVLQYVLIEFVCFLLLLVLVIYIILYRLTDRMVYHFHSESTGGKLKASSLRCSRLPFAYLLTLDEFLDIKVLPIQLNYPGSIVNIDDYRSYCDISDEKFLDNVVVTALTNALIVLVVQGLLGINCKSYFAFDKRGNINSYCPVQDYSVYKVPPYKHKTQVINGDLENLFLENIGQDLITVSRLVYNIFRGTGCPNSRCLFELILVKEVEQKGWGNTKEKYFNRMSSKRVVEFNELHKQLIKIDKEKVKQLSSELQKQHPNLLPTLKEEILFGMNGDAYDFS